MSDLPVITAACRTPIAARSGALADLSAAELAAAVIAPLAAKTANLSEVVLGNSVGPGGNIARVGALTAGLDWSIPAQTVDFQCGSGLAAIINGYQALTFRSLRMNMPQALIAGGVESPSTAPTRISSAGIPYTRAPFAPAVLDVEMTLAAQQLAELKGYSRQAQEDYAVRSHELALQAAAEREQAAITHTVLSKADLHTVNGAAKTLARVTEVTDDGPRRNSAKIFSRLQPLYAAADPQFAVTAASAARIADGAAACLIENSASANGQRGLVLRGSASVGADPRLPGLLAAPAISAALTNAGVDVTAITAFEIVEAYSAQMLATLEALQLGTATTVDQRVNVLGGALALGHPWGASGAVVVANLFESLVLRNYQPGALGVAVCAVGGGQGIAAVFEVV